MVLSSILWHSASSTTASEGHWRMRLAIPTDDICWHLDRLSSWSSRRLKANLSETSVTRLQAVRRRVRSPRSESIEKPLQFSEEVISSRRSNMVSMNFLRFASFTISSSALLRSDIFLYPGLWWSAGRSGSIGSSSAGGVADLSVSKLRMAVAMSMPVRALSEICARKV